MSKVLSFRLDENNPREAQASQIIETWASRGYTLRYLLVEALLAYAEEKPQQNNISLALEKIIALVQELRIEPESGNGPHSTDIHLSEAFLNAVTKATRPGLRAS